MSTTTIKVDSATRDRLAHLARARGTTMSALLSDVAEHLETEQRWSDIGAAYERMQHEDSAITTDTHPGHLSRSEEPPPGRDCRESRCGYSGTAGRTSGTMITVWVRSATIFVVPRT